MIRVGVAGWSYPDWAGTVYPRAKPRGFHALDYLAPYVDAVEVNSSFYALPDVRHVERWAAIASVHAHLVFTAKLHQDLTHGTWSAARLDTLAALLGALEPLRAAGRLVALLAQFPLGFVHGPEACRHLAELSGGLRGREWVVEVRHRSWFEPAGLAFLRGLGAGVAHLDLPFSPQHLPADAPQVGRLGYLRLHGRNAKGWFTPGAGRDAKYDHRYAPAELAEVAERARRIDRTVESTLVIANNHFGGKAVAAVLELRARLAGHPVPAPEPVAATFPDLAPWITPSGQQRLF